MEKQSQHLTQGENGRSKSGYTILLKANLTLPVTCTSGNQFQAHSGVKEDHAFTETWIQKCKRIQPGNKQTQGRKAKPASGATEQPSPDGSHGDIRQVDGIGREVIKKQGKLGKQAHREVNE